VYLLKATQIPFNLGCEGAHATVEQTF
jgi:hypothetical protein